MAPTEQTILTSFLLRPSPLPQILTLQQFTQHFPKAQQSSPEVRRLYRALQHQRARLSDRVAANIETEVRLGKVMRREVVRARRLAEDGGGVGGGGGADGAVGEDEEMALERMLFTETSNLPTSRQHTLRSILPELAAAAEDIEAEIQALEAEAERLLGDIQGTIGGLSDLRYGRFENENLGVDVLEGLHGLQSVCDAK